MNDHKLLKLAAKAAGILTPSWYGNASYIDGMLSRWNPLEDDGDAFRLAIRLKMEVDFDDVRVAVRTRQGIKVLEDEGGDLYAATRRAIVRAAAEIGAAAQKGTP